MALFASWNCYRGCKTSDLEIDRSVPVFEAKIEKEFPFKSQNFSFIFRKTESVAALKQIQVQFVTKKVCELNYVAIKINFHPCVSTSLYFPTNQFSKIGTFEFCVSFVWNWQNATNKEGGFWGMSGCFKVERQTKRLKRLILVRKRGRYGFQKRKARNRQLFHETRSVFAASNFDKHLKFVPQDQAGPFHAAIFVFAIFSVNSFTI